MVKKKKRKMWCPICQDFTPHSIGHVGDENQVERTERVGKKSSDAMGLWRRQYCEGCHESWPSIEIPMAFLDSLMAFRDQVEAQSELLSRQAEYGWHAKKFEPIE